MRCAGAEPGLDASTMEVVLVAANLGDYDFGASGVRGVFRGRLKRALADVTLPVLRVGLADLQSGINGEGPCVNHGVN
jgi:hypothetical protein